MTLAIVFCLTLRHPNKTCRAEVNVALNGVLQYHVINNNYCKTSIAPISLKSSSSEAQHTKSFGFSYMETQAKFIIGAWNCRTVMVEKQFQTNMFSVFFLRKVRVYNFRRFNCNKELIPNCWRSHKNARFPIFSLGLGTKVV